MLCVTNDDKSADIPYTAVAVAINKHGSDHILLEIRTKRRMTTSLHEVDTN